MQVTNSDAAAAKRSLEHESLSGPILRTILTTSRESILVVDRDMRLTAWNEPAIEVFARGNSLLGRRLTEIVRDLDLHEAFRRSIASGIESEVRLELISHERRKFDVHVARLDLDGDVYAIAYFYEMTRIERLEAVRQEFLSNISHELRTPLTSILAFVETLEDGGIDDADNNRRFLSVIRRNATRMHNLIDDISELSLIESGKVSVEKRPVKLFDLVSEVFSSLGSKAADRDITVINAVVPGMTVDADTVRLEQILVNLIDNAIKFDRLGGCVTVGHERVKGADIITVSDRGEGILPEHLDRIFERFYRVDRARSREIGGTGLGLSIVKHLAKLHGGSVTVTSVLNEGTTFRVELPIE